MCLRDVEDFIFSPTNKRTLFHIYIVSTEIYNATFEVV